MSKHFVQRVRQRIGPHVDPLAVMGYLRDGLQRGDPDIEFVTRISKSGLRLFRFTCPGDGRDFYVVVETPHMHLITVMPPGFTVNRIGKAPLQLPKEMI